MLIIINILCVNLLLKVVKGYRTRSSETHNTFKMAVCPVILLDIYKKAVFLEKILNINVNKTLYRVEDESKNQIVLTNFTNFC